MSTEHTITKKAADGTLTLAELRDFFDEYDKVTQAPHSTAADGSDVVAGRHNHLRPKARVGFGGGLKSITVTISGEAEQR